jgi:uncharacterized membrane protein YfcA
VTPSLLVALFVVAILSGATAAIIGFGIGSLLTPMLASAIGMDLAVAAVAIPHAVATALRCWRLRKSIDWTVLKGFGLLSAAGGLAGALAYARLDAAQLSRVLGALLVLTALAQFSGLVARWRPHGLAVGLLGLGSGFFGGIAGNQGGLRAAALTAFDLSPLPFIATKTAIGLLVDAARAPVYLFVTGRTLLALWLPISLASLGVVIGTILGERILIGLPRHVFATIVASAVGLLGMWLLFL